MPWPDGVGVEFVDVFTYLTGNSSTIDGGIRLADSGPFDILAGATVHGGISVEGHNLLGLFLCGSRIYGSVDLESLVDGIALLGDPEEDLFDNGTCAGNTIQGSIALRNSNFILPFNGESNEIEGNTASGSVRVDHSTAEVYGNTIGGSLLCRFGSVIQPPGPVDPSTNTVHGANTCL